jgi:[acyl-carrier-protein] S-malonyltransferase
MTTTAFLFPGQGSQFVGMCQSLHKDSAVVRETFAEASEAIGVDVAKLCFEGPEEKLKLTANTQPCILTASVAVWRALKEKAPAATSAKPVYFAGHSLGEYSALVAANVLSLTQAVKLVRKRGEAMQQAVPEGVGAMAAVMGSTVDDLEAACKNASTTSSQVTIANYNSEAQLVVAGHADAVKRLLAALETAGKRFVQLPVSAPFHTALMSPARQVMASEISAAQFSALAPQSFVVPNISGKPVSVYEKDFLIQQIDSPVRWLQSMQNLWEAGARTFVEVGPGKVLFGLARRIVPKEAKLVHTEDLAQTISALASSPF